MLYDTSTEKKVLPIQLEFQIIFPAYDIVKNQQLVNVYKNMGESDMINSGILSFNYDPSVADCYVRIPDPYRPNERFFITDGNMLRDNYPSYQGIPPYEFRFAADNPRVGLWPR